MQNRPSQTNSSSQRILILDQHPLVQRGLRSLLENEASLTVCAACETETSGLEAILSLSPDLVILDPVLLQDDGLVFIKSIRDQFPSISILVLTTYGTKSYVQSALDAGATGYVEKQEMGETVIAAIYSSLNGDIYLSPRLKRKLQES